MLENTIAKFYRLMLAACVAAGLIFHLAILWESRKPIAAGYGDFIIFYTGAQIINDGKSKELFKVETRNTHQPNFLDFPSLMLNQIPERLMVSGADLTERNHRHYSELSYVTEEELRKSNLPEFRETKIRSNLFSKRPRPEQKI